MENVNISNLPSLVREQISQLKRELDEGEITQKGFNNRLQKLLQTCQSEQEPQKSSNEANACIPPGPENVKHKRGDPRFRSDIREDAVREALSHTDNKVDSIFPNKRDMTYANAGSSDESGTDSSIGDLVDENPNVYTNSSGNNTSRKKNHRDSSDAFDKLVANAAAQLAEAASISSVNSSSRKSSNNGFERVQPSHNSLNTIDENNQEIDFSQSQNNHNNKPINQRYAQQTADQQNDKKNNVPSEILRSAQLIASGGSAMTSNIPPRQININSNTSSVDFVCEERVTDKIRKLVNTLKRPKIRPLEENFIDDSSTHLVSLSEDPDAPKPRGTTIKPIVGDPLNVPSGLPRNLELALSRYAGLNEKAPAITCITSKGLPSVPLTFYKLKQKALKISYVLLNKLGQKNELSLKPRDRVALVFGNNEPMSFITCFYACILASLVPIAIEVPSSRRDSSCQAMGFLLSMQEISIVLTSDQCFRGLHRGPQGEILSFPGWPKVTWINCDSQILNSSFKPPKDWQPPDRLTPNEPMFTEYSYSKDGSVHGVVHSRQSVLAHCRALTVACGYSEVDTMVCVIDMRREMGFWHAVLTGIFNGIHVIFVPYAIMQMDPASWLKMITKFKATVALARSRDLFWGMSYQKDHSTLNLSSLRMILVENGSNPWSQITCEDFANKFIPYGLCPDVICPAASSAEATTICLRRPLSSSLLATKRLNLKNTTSISSAKGNISMNALSYCVVRVDEENDKTSLTLQDCGQVLPGVSLVAVKFGPVPVLCKTDEVGEICISSDYSPIGYWGLDGATKNTFRVRPVNDAGEEIGDDCDYIRTGLIGFSGPSNMGGLVFICGTMNGLIKVERRYHNSDDIIATILAVPNRLIFRNRVAVFGLKILNEERVCVVGEIRNDSSEKATFAWMSQVMQAVESIHQFSIYCIAMVGQHNLPKTPFGGINIHEVRKMLNKGSLSPTVLLMSPHAAIQNLPIPRNPIAVDVGPSAMMVGQMVQGVRLAEANGRSLNLPNLANGQSAEIKYLPNLLTWRAEHTPDDILFSLFNAKGCEGVKITAGQFYQKVERIKSLLMNGSIAKSVQLQPGCTVALMFPPNAAIDLAVAFYACLSLGIIPVIVKAPRFNLSTSNIGNSPVASQISAFFGLNSKPQNVNQSRLSLNSSVTTDSLNNINESSTNLSSSSSNISCYAISGPPPVTQEKYTLEKDLEMAFSIVFHTKSLCIITNSFVVKNLKSKNITATIPFTQWPTFVDCDEYHRKKNVHSVCFARGEHLTAYLDVNISTTGTFTTTQITHSMINAMCLSQKMQCEFYPTMKVLVILEPISGLGMILWLLTSIYCGHHTILIPPSVLDVNPELWISVANNEEIRDAFCTYSVIESSMKNMGKQIEKIKQKNLSLSRLRSLVIVAEERPRVQLTNTFIKIFSVIGLNARAVSTSFGCKTNISICLQGSTSPDLTIVYVDKLALRNDRIKLVEKGSPNSLCLMESGKLLPGIHVVIANPDTLGQCSDSQLGEIWIESSHNCLEINGPFSLLKVNSQVNSGSLFNSLSNSHSSITELSDDVSAKSHKSLMINGKLPKSGINAGMGCEDQLKAKLATGDTSKTFVRTGFLGFVRRTDRTQADGHFHDALFVVGNLEETICLRGMRYHPIDIETTVLKSHRKICQSAVFTWSNLLVVVAELYGHEHEAIDLVHPIVSTIVEDHQLIAGVVVIVDPGTIPITHQGDKQRMLLRQRFVSDILDPIYVSYNM